MLSPQNDMRNTANVLITNEMWTTGSQLLQLFRDKDRTLSQCHSSFKLDLVWLESIVTGTGGQELFTSVMMEASAGTPGRRTVKEACQQLHDQGESMLFKVLPTSNSTSLEEVAKVVQGMKLGKPPCERTMKCCPLFKDIYNNLENLIPLSLTEAVPSAGSAGAAVPSNVHQALNILFDQASTLSEGGELGIDHVNLISPFSYLMNEDQKTRLSAITRQCWADAMKSPTATPRRNNGGAAPSATGTTPESTTGGASEADIDGFFETG